MSAIARFDGITIAIFCNDHDPPYIHVRYADYGMSVDIMTRESLGGWLPPRIFREVKRWLAINKVDCLYHWYRIQRHEPIDKKDRRN
ncbi:MAG: DUF4160 domain-containing protein [Candidatus Kapaibacterium sp.]